MRCGFTWKAPYLHAPPSKQVTSVEQTCSLPRGHEGAHRSLAGVVREQSPPARRGINPLRDPGDPAGDAALRAVEGDERTRTAVPAPTTDSGYVVPCGRVAALRELDGPLAEAST